jgi:hypothetical protein
MSSDWKAKLRYFPCHSIVDDKCTCHNAECENQGKHPKLIGWQEKTTTSELQVAAWRKDPKINLGIATGKSSGIFVLDIDKGGPESLAKLEAEHEPLPQTYTVKTGSGGFHKYFKYPEFIDIENRTKFSPGLDTRSDGGLVIAPGGRHFSGNLYEEVIDVEPAVAPNWLLKRIVETHFAPLREQSKPGEKITKGGRNTILFALGCFMRNKGFDHESIEAALLKENEKNCSPPLGEAEVKSAAKQASKYLKGRAPDVLITDLVVQRGDDVKRKHLRFLWNPYLPQGKLVHFGGSSAQGKSPVTIDLIARLTAGRPWPLDGASSSVARDVILLNTEDDLADTILPRLDLAGGDGSRLHYVKGTKLTKGSSVTEVGLALDRDMGLLADLARSVKDLSLIVIDPVTNYLGQEKMNAEERMRNLLVPLAALAAELNVVVITVGHFNRREKGTDPLHRIMGAAAFTGIARAVYVFGPDPQSEDNHAHVMACARGALGEGRGLRYHTEAIKQSWDGEESDVIKVIWDGVSSATAEDAVDPTSKRDKSSQAQAAKMLREFLKTGKQPAAACLSFLKQNGFDPDRINTADIRRKAQVGTKQEARQWWWFIEAGSGELGF